MRGVKNFAYDLDMIPGAVNSRVVLLLRSIEAKPWHLIFERNLPIIYSAIGRVFEGDMRGRLIYWGLSSSVPGVGKGRCFVIITLLVEGKMSGGKEESHLTYPGDTFTLQKFRRFALGEYGGWLQGMARWRGTLEITVTWVYISGHDYRACSLERYAVNGSHVGYCYSGWLRGMYAGEGRWRWRSRGVLLQGTLIGHPP